jgi:hypothetical protein
MRMVLRRCRGGHACTAHRTYREVAHRGGLGQVITVSTEGEGLMTKMGEGLMTAVTGTIRDLGLVVDKAVVNPEDKNVLATFYVTDFDQKKVRVERRWFGC